MATYHSLQRPLRRRVPETIATARRGRRGNGHEDSNRMAVVHQRSEAYWHQNAGKVEAVVTKPNTSPNEPGGVTARTIMSRESIAMAPA